MPQENLSLLFVTPFFTPQTGGVATYLEDLRRFLRARGNQVFILKLGDARTLQPCPVVNDPTVYELYLRAAFVRAAPLRSLVAFVCFFIPTLLQLARFVRANNIQLVSLEYPLGYALYFLALRLLTGIKVTVGLHGDDVLSMDHLPAEERAIVARSITRADWIVAHSESLLQRAQERLFLASTRHSVLPCGIDGERLRAQAGRLDRVPGAPFVLTVAKLYPRKGIDVWLQAVHAARQTFGPVRVLIIGDGPERETLEAQARDLGITDIVHFVGDVANDKVAAYFRDCLFFVLPSRSEPFGIVLLEAMCFGKAVLGTRVGGIPEFVVDGQNGVLVPSEDAQALATQVSRLLRDHEYLLRLGKSGRASVDMTYDYRVLAQRYEALYRSIIEEASMPSDHVAAMSGSGRSAAHISRAKVEV